MVTLPEECELLLKQSSEMLRAVRSPNNGANLMEEQLNNNKLEIKSVHDERRLKNSTLHHKGFIKFRLLQTSHVNLRIIKSVLLMIESDIMRCV